MSQISAVFVALAAICWGLSGGIGSILMSEGWDPFVVSLYRGAIGLLCVLGWLARRSGRSGLANPRLWCWSAVAGFGVAGNFSFYFFSISEGSVAVAATLMYCAPVFVYLVSFALGLERPSWAKSAAVVLVLCGIALLTGVYDAAATDVPAIAVGAGLLSGLSYALFIFGFKYAAAHGSPQAVLSIAFGVLVALLVWPAGPSQSLDVLSAPQWPLFLALGVLGAGLSFVIYLRGLRHTPPALASIIAMVEPVTASLFGVLLLQERLSAPQTLGMLMILLTVTAMSIYSSARIGHHAR